MVTTSFSKSSTVWTRPKALTRSSFAPCSVEIAAGRVLLPLIDRLLHLFSVTPYRSSAVGIDEHLKLLPPAPHREHLRHAGDGQEPLPHDPVGDRAEFERVGRRSSLHMPSIRICPMMDEIGAKVGLTPGGSRSSAIAMRSATICRSV
jgi:hypothetical protein